MYRTLLFYGLAGLVLFAASAGLAGGGRGANSMQETTRSMPEGGSSSPITLFLCGDVMTGRGIDQALPHPGSPLLQERYLKNARGYVELAEEAHGRIRQPVSFSYIWGDALDEWERVAPDLRIVNLETSITQSDAYWGGKRVHYRMHPDNASCLTAAGIDYCSLANNHVLDWGYPGLAETLETLRRAGIKGAGAGRTLREAEAPAVMEVPGKGRVIVFSYGSVTSGIPRPWAASADRPGVSLLEDLSDETIQRIKARVDDVKRPGDIVVFSVHWGRNWGYDIPSAQTAFAHRLIDAAGVDLVHGHSSHHLKGIEVYRDRLILYGAGDFINDYEGIGGREAFRPDLALMYFATVDPSTGSLVRLQMTPLQIKHFRLNRAAAADARWLSDVLSREGKRWGTRTEVTQDLSLVLRWE